MKDIQIIGAGFVFLCFVGFSALAEKRPVAQIENPCNGVSNYQICIERGCVWHNGTSWPCRPIGSNK